MARALALPPPMDYAPVEGLDDDLGFFGQLFDADMMKTSMIAAGGGALGGVVFKQIADWEIEREDKKTKVKTKGPLLDKPWKKMLGAAVFGFAGARALWGSPDDMSENSDTRRDLAKGHLGAMGMVLSGVLSMDEAYQAVSWKTVFLLASLIPLGAAVENSGTAAWIAQQTLDLLGGVPGWVLQAAIAVLATFFTLVMSNVGATVLLVPLAVNIAIGAGENPAVYALTVAIATSNSFLIPTHQVNALIMGPGGYRVPDFMKAGGIMTILFLVVSITMLNIVF